MITRLLAISDPISFLSLRYNRLFSRHIISQVLCTQLIPIFHTGILEAGMKCEFKQRKDAYRLEALNTKTVGGRMIFFRETDPPISP